MHKNKGN